MEIDKNHDGTFTATIGDHVYDIMVKSGHNGIMILTLNNVQTSAYSVSDGEDRYLYVDGQHYALTIEDERSSRRRATGASAGNLTAQMPGQVTEVHIAEGDTVESGQTLVILEAMKMEIRITAPTDGIIKQVLVVQGDVVERGQLLIELSSDDVS